MVKVLKRNSKQLTSNDLCKLLNNKNIDSENIKSFIYSCVKICYQNQFL